MISPQFKQGQGSVLLAQDYNLCLAQPSNCLLSECWGSGLPAGDAMPDPGLASFPQGDEPSVWWELRARQGGEAVGPYSKGLLLSVDKVWVGVLAKICL